MQSKKLPMGYFIKQADELLTKGIDEIQFSSGLTRKDWQVLNSIKEYEQISKTELTELIKPFADLEVLNAILYKFKENNLINEEAGAFTLTGKGIELNKVCFEKQKEFRLKAMAGISEQQYQEAISTLEKIIDNLRT